MNEYDCVYRVETASRFARWRIQNLPSSGYRRSDPFNIGSWNWLLSVETKGGLCVKLYPEIYNLNTQNRPIASFIVRVLTAGDREAFTHAEIKDKQFDKKQDFVWAIEDVPVRGAFIVDIEFLDFKIASPNGGIGKPCSIWTEQFTQKTSNINAMALPVFHNIFSRYPIKDLSTITSDMLSIEASQAFLNYYVYGNIKAQEFLTHRLPLLRVAHQYEISELKEACCESLVQDIDDKNVLDMFHTASLYQLPKLKISCLRYLVNVGRIFNIIQADLDAFLQSADRHLIAQLFHQVLSAWKGF